MRVAWSRLEYSCRRCGEYRKPRVGEMSHALIAAVKNPKHSRTALGSVGYPCGLSLIVAETQSNRRAGVIFFLFVHFPYVDLFLLSCVLSISLFFVLCVVLLMW